LLSGGASAFLYNHSGISLTHTVVGTVFQGSNVVSTIKPGYNFIGLQVPIAVTNLVVGADGVSQLPYGLPLSLTSSNCINAANQTPTRSTQDYLLFWSGNGYVDYFFFNAADATAWENGYVAGPAWPAGFYTADGANSAPTIPAGQGFFIYHYGSTINWTNTFSVQ
jgi:hypothetical protein